MLWPHGFKTFVLEYVYQNLDQPNRPAIERETEVEIAARGDAVRAPGRQERTAREVHSKPELAVSLPSVLHTPLTCDACS